MNLANGINASLQMWANVSKLLKVRVWDVVIVDSFTHCKRTKVYSGSWLGNFSWWLCTSSYPLLVSLSCHTVSRHWGTWQTLFPDFLHTLSFHCRSGLLTTYYYFHSLSVLPQSRWLLSTQKNSAYQYFLLYIPKTNEFEHTYLPCITRLQKRNSSHT